MHIFKIHSKMIAAAAVLTAWAAAGLAQQPATAQPATAQQAQSGKKVKDQGEYDIYNQALKDQPTDPKKTIQDLDTWTQKYPDSDYKWDRLYMYMQAYAKVNPPQPDKVVQYGQQLIGQDLKAIFNDKYGPQTILYIYYLTTVNVAALPNPTPEQIDLGKKAAQQLQQQAVAFFTPANKPAGTSDADWTKAKSDIDAAADHTLLYLEVLPANQAMAKNDCATAEPMYVKALQDRPQSSYISFQLAKSMICLQKTKPEMASAAIYEFERAAVIDPTLGDPKNNPEQLKKYADDLYTRVHGGTDGLAELKNVVKQNPLPPDNFIIKSKEQAAAEKEAEFAKNNPKLALWMGIKNELAGANGEQYFTGTLKDSAVPQLRGIVVEGRPACRSKEILVYVPEPGQQGQQQPEIAIKLDTPLAGKPDPGSEIMWEGVPTAFSKSPFLLTMDSEKAKVDVKTSPCAAAAPVHKKSAARKKK